MVQGYFMGHPAALTDGSPAKSRECRALSVEGKEKIKGGVPSDERKSSGKWRGTSVSLNTFLFPSTLNPRHFSSPTPDTRSSVFPSSLDTCQLSLFRDRKKEVRGDGKEKDY